MESSRKIAPNSAIHQPKELCLTTRGNIVFVCPHNPLCSDYTILSGRCLSVYLSLAGRVFGCHIVVGLTMSGVERDEMEEMSERKRLFGGMPSSLFNVGVIILVITIISLMDWWSPVNGHTRMKGRVGERTKERKESSFSAHTTIIEINSARKQPQKSLTINVIFVVGLKHNCNFYQIFPCPPTGALYFLLRSSSSSWSM